MKKSLIALAVMAASGAAMAQSSVTLYGIVDLWFGTLKVDGVPTQTKLDSGGVNTNRWGLKGSEDLGNGLTANFNLETAFKSDDGSSGTVTNRDGAVSTPAFARAAWVGVSGGFGAVKLGYMSTALDDVNGASHAVFDSQLSPHQIFRSDDYTSRPGNTIHYTTPTFSGLTAAVSYSLGEDKGAAVSASKTTSFNVKYAGGPFAAQLGYQADDRNTSANDAKYTVLGGSYDLGVAKLKANYGQVSNAAFTANNDVKDWQVGVDVPVSAALTVSASYAKSKADLAATADLKGYGIGAAYSLSKRTTVYGGYRASTSTLATVDTDTKLFAVGINHKF